MTSNFPVNPQGEGSSVTPSSTPATPAPNTGATPAVPSAPRPESPSSTPPAEGDSKQEEEESGEEEAGPEIYEPWVITSEKFLPFHIGGNEVLSIVAVCESGMYDTEYSVSFVFGLSEYEEPVADNETVTQLQERLRKAVVREINGPSRATLINNRF